MKKLTKTDILKFAKDGNQDPVKIKKIKMDLTKKITSTTENPTVTYVLNIFNSVIEHNTQIETFSRKQGSYLLIYDASLAKLNTLIENSIGKIMSGIDIMQINISDAESCHAAEALEQLLKLHNAQFTHSITVEGNHDDYSVVMANNLNEVITKIKQYKDRLIAHTQEATLAAEAEKHQEAKKDPGDFNEYIKNECELIRQVIDQNLRIEKYIALRDEITRTINEQHWNDEQTYDLRLIPRHVTALAPGVLYLKDMGDSGIEYTVKNRDQDRPIIDTINATELATIGIFVPFSPNHMIKSLKPKITNILNITSTRHHTNKPYMLLKGVIDFINTTLTEENEALIENTITLEQGNAILNGFDSLASVFSKKITELEGRRDRLNEDKQKTYTPAIIDANMLASKLKMVRDTFEQTRNVATFIQATEALFNEYKHYESFKTNRSTPWFRTFISKPLEQIKAFINQITAYLYKMICKTSPEKNNYKGTLFNPPETDTTKQLNEFHGGVKKQVRHVQRP